MSRRLVTSNDVARLAGVSQSTVSRAFRPGAPLSPTLRAKVEQAAAALGYTPNAFARGMIRGHSGVGKSTLINALIPDAQLRIGEVSRYGTGRQTTTSALWLPAPGDGTIIDTPGIRTLSVRGLDRGLLRTVFPEFPADWIEDPSGFDPEDEDLDLSYPERLQSLQRLWQEMEERNPNQNTFR